MIREYAKIVIPLNVFNIHYLYVFSPLKSNLEYQLQQFIKKFFVANNIDQLYQENYFLAQQQMKDSSSLLLGN